MNQRQTHHKLVRDRIPDIIRASGNDCEVVALAGEQYLQALRQKLIEEATEAASAQTRDDLIKELADLSEVMDALMAAAGIEGDRVAQVQQQRRDERGGFEKRLKLLWTEIRA